MGWSNPNGGWNNSGRGWYGGPHGGSSYSGPGDVLGSATMFGGLRAYNSAYASGTNPAIDVVDSSGTNLTTINITSSGFIDTAALSSFNTAHGTPSVTKVYDQTGNANHWTQATVATMPTIVFSAINGYPAMAFNGSQRLLVSVPILSAYTESGVAKRTSGFSSAQAYLEGGPFPALGWLGTNTAWFVPQAGDDATVSSGTLDNVWVAGSGAYSSSFGATFYANGTSTTSTGSALVGGVSYIGGSNWPFTGQVAEVGFWPVDGTASLASLQSNMRSATNGWNF